jgi:hypothetical protein
MRIVAQVHMTVAGAKRVIGRDERADFALGRVFGLLCGDKFHIVESVGQMVRAILNALQMRIIM